VEQEASEIEPAVSSRQRGLRRQRLAMTMTAAPVPHAQRWQRAYAFVCVDGASRLRYQSRRELVAGCRLL
jgi:hypothetical protein